MTTLDTSEPGLLRAGTEVIEPLRRCFRELLDAIDIPPAGKAASLRHGGMHATLRSRLTRALATNDIAVSLYHMPGAEGLRQALQVARKAGANLELLERCEECIVQYEQFLDREELGRDTIHTLLGSVLPEAKDTARRVHSQSAFKAISNLMGYCADVVVFADFHFPSPDDPNMCSSAAVWGCANWRRMHHDCTFSLSGNHGVDEDKRAAPSTFDGRPLKDLASPPLLEEFSEGPVPKYRLVDFGGRPMYEMNASEVGVRSECSFYFGAIYPYAQPVYRDANNSVGFAASFSPTPAKRLLFDVCIHKDLWPQATPNVECYRTVPHGFVRPEARAQRGFDRIDLGITARALPQGIAGLSSAALTRYREMIRMAIDRLGYDVNDFRTYRCDVSYPMYGVQHSMVWDLPAKQM